MIDLRNGDCLEELKKLPEKSIDLVLTDPPYNIALADWDKWPSYAEYVEFMKKVFAEVSRVLTDAGSLYFFHSDMEQVAMLMEMIRENFDLTFNSFIVWDKGDFRSLAWKNVTQDNNLRSWFNTCEYCLYYTKGKSKTGWETVCLDVSNFASLREYAYELMQFIGISGGVLPNSSDIEKQSISSIAKKKILATIGGRGDHFTRYGSTQWSLCTEEVYQELTEKFNLRMWSGFREYESLRQEYESLRQEYESLRQVHNLDQNHNNVWRLTSQRGENLHPCQKPEKLIERIIRVSSNPGQKVLDCFMGSGTTGVAAKKLNRDFIGIERDKKYFDLAKSRIDKATFEPDLFGDCLPEKDKKEITENSLFDF